MYKSETSYGDKLIAVTGALGNQGRSVVNALLEKGFRVRALVRKLAQGESARSEEKQRHLQSLKQKGCEIVDCEFSDRGSLKEAFTGAWGVFAVTDFWAPEIHCTGNFKLEQTHGKNQIDAAAEAGVSFVIYSSLPDLNQLSGGAVDVPHFANKAIVEQHARNHPDLKAAAFAWMGSFMSNFTNPRFGATPRLEQYMTKHGAVTAAAAAAPGESKNVPVGESVSAMGTGASVGVSGGKIAEHSTEEQQPQDKGGLLVVDLPVRADVRIPLLDVADCGLIVARMFEQGPERWKNQHVLVASEYLSIPEQCEIWSSVIKRPVIYNRQTWDEYSETHKEHSNKEIDAMFKGWDAVGYYAGEDLAKTKRDFPGVKLTSFAEYLREHGADVERALQLCGHKEKAQQGTHGASGERSRHALFAPRGYSSASAPAAESSTAASGAAESAGAFDAPSPDKTAVGEIPSEQEAAEAIPQKEKVGGIVEEAAAMPKTDISDLSAFPSAATSASTTGTTSLLEPLLSTSTTGGKQAPPGGAVPATPPPPIPSRGLQKKKTTTIRFDPRSGLGRAEQDSGLGGDVGKEGTGATGSSFADREQPLMTQQPETGTGFPGRETEGGRGGGFGDREAISGGEYRELPQQPAETWGFGKSTAGREGTQPQPQSQQLPLSQQQLLEQQQREMRRYEREQGFEAAPVSTSQQEQEQPEQPSSSSMFKQPPSFEPQRLGFSQQYGRGLSREEAARWELEQQQPRARQQQQQQQQREMQRAMERQQRPSGGRVSRDWSWL